MTKDEIDEIRRVKGNDKKRDRYAEIFAFKMLANLDAFLDPDCDFDQAIKIAKETIKEEIIV